MDQKDIRNRNCFNFDKFGCNLPNKRIEEAVRTLIKVVGDNPDREGLKNTPARVAHAYSEWFGGYGKDPEDILNVTFPSEGYDDMIVVKNIDYTSHCEHHITPFLGKAHMALVAGKRISGLDKYIKLVDIYARRLQTQEVMTHQIGEALKKVLKPKGIMVVVEGKHNCVWSRETKNQGAELITTYRYGLFKTKLDLESRFLQYLK